MCSVCLFEAILIDFLQLSMAQHVSHNYTTRSIRSIQKEREKAKTKQKEQTTAACTTTSFSFSAFFSYSPIES